MQSFEKYSIPQAAILTAWRLVRCNPLHFPKTGYGLDEPTWPPPAYWAGDGRLRTSLDDELSRLRALRDLDSLTGPQAMGQQAFDPLEILAERSSSGQSDEEDRGSDVS